MRIIVNRGFDKVLARLVVFKNGQKTIGCSINEDYCEFDAKENDHIDIKLKFLDTTTLTVASFVCKGEDETVYVSPTFTLSQKSRKLALCLGE